MARGANGLLYIMYSADFMRLKRTLKLHCKRLLRQRSLGVKQELTITCAGRPPTCQP